MPWWLAMARRVGVLDGDDAHEYPARIAFTTPGAPLHVHWCP